MTGSLAMSEHGGPPSSSSFHGYNSSAPLQPNSSHLSQNDVRVSESPGHMEMYTTLIGAATVRGFKSAVISPVDSLRRRQRRETPSEITL